MTLVGFLLQPKFIAMVAIAAVVFALLKTRRMGNQLKVAVLLVSTFLFGIAGNLPVDFFSSFAMHPSPICAFTKPLLFGLGIPFLGTIIVISALTLVGPKLFCGWVCPVGAIQELVSMLSDRLQLRRFKLPFTMTNAIRLAFFLVFIGVSTTGVLAITTSRGTFPKSLYDYVNPFHGLEIGVPDSLLTATIQYLPFLVVLGLSVVTYRPFCYALCPVGLVTHWLEQIGLFRVTLLREPCVDCDLCTKKSLCPTVPEMLKETALRPDCFSCTRCTAACPKDALLYGTRRTVGTSARKRNKRAAA